MFFPGSVIGGRYELGHLLGEGGIGTVWAATHTVTKKRVAIKLLKADVASPDILRRFIREARAASVVRHPNVVEVHDIVSLDDGTPALVMDLLEGETLAQRLRRAGALPLHELAETLAPVISAVARAHAAGIVHRDLKPDNIILARLGDGRIAPKVLDFGIAKVLPTQESLDGGEALTRTGAVIGTPYYMAPEQAFGEKDVDARADVWALGVILFESATGTRPINADTLGKVYKCISSGNIPRLVEVAPELPREFARLVDRMLSTDRERRPRDLEEPLALLSRMTLKELARPRRNRTTGAVAAVAALALASVAISAALRTSSRSSRVADSFSSAPLSEVVGPVSTQPVGATPAPAEAIASPAPLATPPAIPPANASRGRARPAASRPAPSAKPAEAQDGVTAVVLGDRSLPGGVSGEIPF